MDKKKRTKQRIIALAIFAAVLFVAAMAISSSSVYKTSRKAEKLDNIDMYKMHDFSEQNSDAVMKALASGDSKKLSNILIDSEGAEALIEFADWKKADFDKAVSMGSGSLSDGPDKNGKMDISERFFVDIDGERYVMFIETSTSRWGRVNDGVSAAAATTLDHFDELDWMWNGEPDDGSVLAGKLLWNAE